MLRSIKSGQRHTRVLAFTISGSGGSLTVSGLDAKQVTVNSSDEIIFDKPFGEAPQLTVGTGTSSKTKITGADAGEYLIIGSDVTDRY